MGRLCVVLLVILAACGDDDDCIEVDLTCQPLYDPPTFDAVFDNVFMPKCGVPGSACHSADGRKNGLAFATKDEAYDLLLESRVKPGNPGCSLLARRIESTDPAFQMPPGARLSAGERCAILRWIANGAER